MNNKGQFLLYDLLMSVIIILIVLVCITYVLNQEENTYTDYSKAIQSLETLNSIQVHGENLLHALSNDDEEAQKIAGEVLEGNKYTLKDLEKNKTLLQVNATKYKEVITSRKKVEGNEYELSIYI